MAGPVTTSLSVVQSATVYPLAAFGRVEVEWGNVIGLPDMQDVALDLPNAAGLVFVPQTPKTRIFSVRLVIARTTEAAVNDSLIQLAGLLNTPTAAIQFRRVIPTGAGNITADAFATYLTGFAPERPAPNVALLAPEFRMLSPYWINTATATAVAV